ncbi:hypothetical protein GCM10028819_05040 [Spirosoma humi]
MLAGSYATETFWEVRIVTGMRINQNETALRLNAKSRKSETEVKIFRVKET